MNPKEEQPVTRDQITALRDKLEFSGDLAAAGTCNMALHGDARALEVVTRVIRDNEEAKS